MIFFFNHSWPVILINVKYAPENILHSVLLFWLPITVLVIWEAALFVLDEVTIFQLGFESCVLFVVFSNTTLIMGWVGPKPHFEG